MRPEVARTDLDEVIALPAQGPGDGPVPLHGDVHDGDAHAQVLYVGDHGGHVLVPADQHGVTQDTGAGQGGQVTLDVTLHTLTTPGSDPGTPELDAGDVRDAVLFLGAPLIGDRLVPVATQQRQTSAVAGHFVEELDESGIVPGDGVPIPGSVHGHRAVREKVSRVDEQRAAVHDTAPFPFV